MKVATLVGLILLVLGVLGFALGGFSFTRREKVLDVGPIQATADREHSVAVSPVLSVIAIVGGIVLIAAGARRT